MTSQSKEKYITKKCGNSDFMNMHGVSPLLLAVRGQYLFCQLLIGLLLAQKNYGFVK